MALTLNYLLTLFFYRTGVPLGSVIIADGGPCFNVSDSAMSLMCKVKNQTHFISHFHPIMVPPRSSNLSQTCLEFCKNSVCTCLPVEILIIAY